MKVFKILGSVFVLVGLGLIVPATIVASNTLSFRATASRATGTVFSSDGSGTSGKATSTPIVRFALPNEEEVEIVGSVSSRPPAYDVGEKVDVLYDPERPREGRIDSIVEMWFIPILLGGMGLVFLAVGLPFLLWPIYRRRQVAWLKTSGQRLQARIQQIALDTTVRINRRHPYRIVGEWLDPATNTVHIFKSDMLWFDPAPYVTGDTITVVYDPKNLGRYWVDTAFLPKVAE